MNDSEINESAIDEASLQIRLEGREAHHQIVGNNIKTHYPILPLTHLAPHPSDTHPLISQVPSYEPAAGPFSPL